MFYRGGGLRAWRLWADWGLVAVIRSRRKSCRSSIADAEAVPMVVLAMVIGFPIAVFFRVRSEEGWAAVGGSVKAEGLDRKLLARSPAQLTAPDYCRRGGGGHLRMSDSAFRFWLPRGGTAARKAPFTLLLLSRLTIDSQSDLRLPFENLSEDKRMLYFGRGFRMRS